MAKCDLTGQRQLRAAGGGGDFHLPRVPPACLGLLPPGLPAAVRRGGGLAARERGALRAEWRAVAGNEWLATGPKPAA